MCTINICFYDGLTSLLFFVCTLIFEKRELKIINCFNRMCTLTDISIIAEWIFLKWRKTCCVYIIVMGLGNSGNKPMGSSNRIEFGQAHGRNKIDNIFSMASCPNIINIWANGLSNFCRYVMPVSITNNDLIWVSIFRNKTEFW